MANARRTVPSLYKPSAVRPDCLHRTSNIADTFALSVVIRCKRDIQTQLNRVQDPDLTGPGSRVIELYVSLHSRQVHH